MSHYGILLKFRLRNKQISSLKHNILYFFIWMVFHLPKHLVRVESLPTQNNLHVLQLDRLVELTHQQKLMSTLSWQLICLAFNPIYKVSKIPWNLTNFWCIGYKICLSSNLSFFLLALNNKALTWEVFQKRAWQGPSMCV